ncbi:hypothetical protein TNCT_349631 [Trichonephila clavata]|uniref:Uncharacterized protein n=1 Tax=Trichonephila clavata TaxID=2740835 RepID=A0A8X6M4W5_TRICU|nr:hypothetical protein TNCT_349631 [Trichonephila clavata]
MHYQSTDRIQNIVLRMITGAAKSIPIDTMEAQLQIEALEVHREKSALYFWERSRRINKYWESYQRATDRLKTQRTPITCSQNLYTKNGIALGEPAPLNTYPDFFQHLLEAEYCLTDHNFRKHASLDSELRSAALQTVHEQHPRSSWFHIFIDGSSMPGTGETGTAYYCQEFQVYSKVVMIMRWLPYILQHLSLKIVITLRKRSFWLIPKPPFETAPVILKQIERELLTAGKN